MTPIQMEGRIERWIKETTGTQVEINSTEAVALLKKFGILTDYENRLHVLPLHAAMRNLPQLPQSIVARAAERDVAEGYDRDAFAETEDQYKREDQLHRRIGWF